MEKFYDIKGVGHYSETTRDAANRSYASQEYEQTSLLREQTRLQEEQLRLAKESEAAQRAHNERIEDLAAKELAETQALRQFNQDLEWLERSGANERLEYLLERREQEVVATLADEVFESSGLREDKRAGFKDVLAAFFATDRAWLSKTAELKRLQSSLSMVEKVEAPGLQGYLCLTLGLISGMVAAGFLLSVAEDVKQSAWQDLDIWFALVILCPAVMAFWLLRKYLRARKRFSQARAEVPGLTSAVTGLKGKLPALEEEWRRQGDEVARAYRDWLAAGADCLAQTWQRLVDERVVAGRIQTLIGEFEKQFPMPLRVEWSKVEAEIWHRSLDRMESRVLRAAGEKYLNLDLLAAQFKEAKEFTLGQEVAGNISLAEIAKAEGKSPGLGQAIASKGTDGVGRHPGFILPEVRPQELEALGDKLAQAGPAELKAMGFKERQCFIATACYGSGDHPAVDELRQFRDERLLTSEAGTEFVRWYYRWSPGLAKVIEKRPMLKGLVRHLVVAPARVVVRWLK